MEKEDTGVLPLKKKKSVLIAQGCLLQSPIGKVCVTWQANYLGARMDTEPLQMDDPLSYWVTRMDDCQERFQYAILPLGCPAASMPS